MTLREISLTLPNRPGALAGVARILAKDHINVAAISVDSTPARGKVRLIVNDPDRAMGLMSSHGHTVEVREMIAVHLEDRAGSFLRVLEVLEREHVNILSVAILLVRDSGRVLVALSATDVALARRVLHRARFSSASAERLISNRDLVAASPRIPSDSVGLLL